MRFVDIDEIYRRIDEESDRLCLLHRNHPERKWYPGLRRALRMVDGFIREQEEEDAETKKGREVFLRQLRRDQDERQLAEISRAIGRKVEREVWRLSGEVDGVPDHPDAATGQPGGTADNGEASHLQARPELERPAGAVDVDGESVVFAFPQPDGSVHYESTRVRSVVVENDIVTISEALGTGAEDEDDLRAWAEKIRGQAAEMTRLTAYPSSFIEERGVHVQEEGPGPYLVGTHPGGDAGGMDRIPPNDGASDGGRPGGLRGDTGGVRAEGQAHSIPIQSPPGGIAQYPSGSLVPGSIARGTGEA